MIHISGTPIKMDSAPIGVLSRQNSAKMSNRSMRYPLPLSNRYLNVLFVRILELRNVIGL